MTEESFLREVCFEAEKEYWQPILDELASEPDIDISVEADRRTIKYIRKLEKKYLHYNSKISNSFNSKRGLKVLLIAAILIILLSVSAFSFNPLKEFFYNVYTKGTEFFFNYNKNAKDDYLYGEYLYIPNGYKLEYNKKLNHSQKMLYIKDGKQIIINTNTNNHSSLGLNTEKAKTGDIIIGNYKGYYSETERSISVVWTSGQYYHYITADLDNDLITLDTVIKIAESRIPEKK